jgi:hypothetical protein
MMVLLLDWNACIATTFSDSKRRALKSVQYQISHIKSSSPSAKSCSFLIVINHILTDHLHLLCGTDIQLYSSSGKVYNDWDLASKIGESPLFRAVTMYHASPWLSMRSKVTMHARSSLFTRNGMVYHSKVRFNQEGYHPICEGVQ